MRDLLTTTVGRVTLTVALALALLSQPTGDANGLPTPASSPGDFKPGEVLVRLKEGRPATDLASIFPEQECQVKKYIPRFGFYLLAVPTGLESSTVAALRSDPRVEYAGLNYRLYGTELEAMAPSQPSAGMMTAPQRFPDDPLFPWQWNLHNPDHGDGTPDADIDAPEAWDITTGSQEIIIAVLDSGVDLLHEDLSDKLWTNPGEVCDNGKDDDGDKKVDDCHGWDFANWDNEPQDDPPPFGVGTAVAGIAAAATNNGRGIAGISWGARIMPLKVLENGAGWVSDVIAGIEYAIDKGARVVNMSFTTLRGDSALQQIITEAHDQHGMLFVAMAGDCGSGCFINDEYYVNPTFYPAAFDHVIAVGATDRHDERVALSEWGSYLDVMAPGQLIPAPYWDPSYEDPHKLYALFAPTLGSTAVATPHVSGLATLIWSMYPDLSPDEVETIIEASADKTGPVPYDESERNDLYGYGRISADPMVLEPQELMFLVDNAPEPICSTVTNRGTSASTWEATTDVDWLQIDGPSGFVPSWVDVCVVRENLTEYGLYSTTITATTTLSSTVDNPHTVSASLSYRPTLSRFFLPYIFRHHLASQ